MPRSSARTKSGEPRRWNPTVAHAALRAAETAGLSLRAYAAREGFDPQRLYWWRKRLGNGRATGAREPAEFVELPMTAEAPRVDIVLPSGMVLRVAESIDADTLQRFVRALA